MGQLLCYEGNSQVKRAKLQTLRIQYETFKMHNDESITSYFLHIDEVVNCMKNLGEEIKEVTLVEKVLRSLSTKFESKVSAIEEKQDLQTITMTQLHGILTTFEMRKGGPSDMREAAFKASAKGKEKLNQSGHISEEEDEVKFVKKLQRGSGRFRGKLPFKYFAYGRVSHYATKCPHKDKYDKGKESVKWNRKQSHSPLIKTGLGYTEEASQSQKPSTSTKSYLDVAKNSEHNDNRQQRHKADHQVNQATFTSRMNRSHNQPQVNHTQFASKLNRNYNHQVNRFDNSRNFFNGQCFSCHNFGHKAAQCVAYKTIMTIEARNQRNVIEIKRSSYNNFSLLENEIECSICNNFGYEESECRSNFRQISQKEQTPLNPKIWRKKEPQTERCGIALYAEGQENQWYIESGCSKHMTGDKEKLHSYNALEKEKNVSFGNDTSAVIKGKGSIFLKEKIKAGNVMYVDGLKHNLLSVSQMCDQGNEVVFQSNGCVVHELDTGETMIKGTRTPKNLYILKGGQQQ
eukprot:PITA_32501